MNAIVEAPHETAAPSMPSEHLHRLREWLTAQVQAKAGDRVGYTPANVAWIQEQCEKLLAHHNVRLMNGEMKPTGIRPNFSPRLQAAGFKLSGEMFGAGAMGATVKQAGRR